VRQIPQSCIDLVKKSESCVLRVYDDKWPDKILIGGDIVGGTLTAGYGHTSAVLKIGDPVTQNTADTWLKEDLETAAYRLRGVVSDDVIALLTDNQYAALLDFVFNLGAGAGWTIWKRLNAKQFDQVPLEIAKFVNAGGVKLQGLVNRRAAEVALWATDEPGTATDIVPSSVTRATITPPTPSDPVSAVKSKALIMGGIGAIAGAAPMVNQVSQAIQPYAGQSDYVQKMLGVLAMIAAGLAVGGLFYMYLQKRNARN
jgi:lysozyme